MKRCSPVNVSQPTSPIIGRKRKRNWRQTVETDSDSDVSNNSTSPDTHYQESPSSPDFSGEKQVASPTNLEQKIDSSDRSVGNTSYSSSQDVKFSCVSSLPPDRQLSVGCPLLDSGLLGGLRAGELTELVGASSAGKTQFCLQVAVEAAVRGETVIYIVTEGTFPSVRLDQMVTARQAKEATDRILVKQARNLPHLMAVLEEEVGHLVEDVPGVSLLVVDSVASLVRCEAELRTGLERANVVQKIGQNLLQLSGRLQLAVLAVNQVTARLGGQRDLWGRREVASLGQAWAQYPSTRLWLTKTLYVVSRTASAVLQGLMAETRLRTVQVDWSCRLPTSINYFYVDTRGCHGVRVED